MRCPSLKELPSPPPGKRGWPWTEETPQIPHTMPDGLPWPRISIVTPSYNQGFFIEETIRAVLLQGYPNLEYIVCEGGSTDESMEIIKKYRPWMNILVNDRGRGMSEAINKGFESCSGEIITWIASDDVYFPRAFYKVGLSWPGLEQCGAVIGAFHFMDEDSRVDKIKYSPRLPHPGPIDLTLAWPELWRLHQVSTFYIRQALDRVGRFVREDLRYNMDRELLYRICRRYRVFLVEDSLAAFRRHSRSKSWSLSNIIPMAKEFAGIEYLFFTENKADNRRRARIARYQIAKGYIKYAKYNSRTFPSALALMKAVFYRPGLITKLSYIVAWLKVLGVMAILNRLRRRKDRSVPRG